MSASVSFTIKGARGLSMAGKEWADKIVNQLADQTISYYAQQAKQRLEQDTPVRSGALKGSTMIRKQGPGHQELGQTMSYGPVVNARRDYWSGAISVAQEWPRLYQKTCSQEWQVMVRKYSGI